MRWLSRSWVRLLVAVAPIAALLIAISVIATWLEVEGLGIPLTSGGAFGPEASIVAVAICLAAGIAVLVVAHRRGHFVPAFWRR